MVIWCSAVVVPQSTLLTGTETPALPVVHRARTIGDSCCPAAAATAGAEIAETGKRSGFVGLLLLDGASGPGASGSGHGRV